jgi:hypothetical protein
MLLHLGAGFDADDLGRPSVISDYDSCGQLGLCSAAFVRPLTFPLVQGLSDTLAGGFGSSTQFLGPLNRVDSLYQQFVSIASLTWVEVNHTFKFGAELRNGGNYSQNFSTDTFFFSPAHTAMPYAVTVNTSNGRSVSSIGGNNIGFPYASYLLGAVDTANINPYSFVRFGKQQWGFYGQDSWKVTRKLTLDIGLRYDYMRYYQEQHGRSPNFAPTLANPTAGRHPGAVTYQALCHCAFGQNYPFAFGPRIGVAYQVLPKTVIRGGFGITYASLGFRRSDRLCLGEQSPRTSVHTRTAGYDVGPGGHGERRAFDAGANRMAQLQPGLLPDPGPDSGHRTSVLRSKCGETRAAVSMELQHPARGDSQFAVGGVLHRQPGDLVANVKPAGQLQLPEHGNLEPVRAQFEQPGGCGYIARGYRLSGRRTLPE